ncbi:hypothetical protein NDU88_007314 [Pleurodeles waltl]|uniref:Uncharacterized protein n=1 Tax=Pleurodeles waltl TaxID=8319 RepID=A0AAV7N3Q7_PLEWA|nr:hypothetical protein NDU88_007314 [Pleurodeles waltl]
MLAAVSTVSVSSEPRRYRGGNGGARTAGKPIASGAPHTRNSCDADLHPGTPQERVEGLETHGSSPAEKAWQEGRSRVIRRPGPVRPWRLRGSLVSRGDCDDPRLPINSIQTYLRTFAPQRGDPIKWHGPSDGRGGKRSSTREAGLCLSITGWSSQHGRSTPLAAEV